MAWAAEHVAPDGTVRTTKTSSWSAAVEVMRSKAATAVAYDDMPREAFMFVRDTLRGAIHYIECHAAGHVFTIREA